MKSPVTMDNAGDNGNGGKNTDNGEYAWSDSDDEVFANIDDDEALNEFDFAVGERVKKSRFAPKGALVKSTNDSAQKDTKEKMLKLLMSLERVYGRRTEIDTVIQARGRGEEAPIPPMWKLDSKAVRMADIPGVGVFGEEERKILLTELQGNLELIATTAQINTLTTLMACMDKTCEKIQDQLTELEDELPDDTRDDTVEELRDLAAELVKKETRVPKISQRVDSDSGTSSAGTSAPRNGPPAPWRKNNGRGRGGGPMYRGKPNFRPHPYS